MPRWAWVAVAQLVAGAALLLALPAGVRPAVPAAAGAAAVVVLAVAAFRSRGAGRVVWALLATTQAAETAGWALLTEVAGTPPAEAAGELLRGSASLPAVAALLLLTRGRGADRRAVVDAAVLGTAAGVTIWVLLLSPDQRVVAGPSAWLDAAGLHVAVELALFVVAAMLAFAPRRTRADVRLFGWVGLHLAGDGLYELGSRHDAALLGAVGFSLLLTAVAALTVAAAVAAATADEPWRATPAPAWPRKAAIVTAVLLLPALLVLRSAQSSGDDVTLVVAGSVAVTVLFLGGVLLSRERYELPPAAAESLRRSVRRLCLGFAVLALLPLGGLTYLSVHQVNRTVEREVQRRLTAASDVAATYVGEHLAGVGALVTAYAERRLLAEAVAASGSGPSPALQRHLVGLESRSADFAGAWVLDADGAVLAFDPAQPSMIGRDLSGAEWFRGAIEAPSGESFVSGAFEADLPGRPHVVAVSAPVYSGGRVVGVLALGYRLEALAGFTSSLTGAQQVALQLADRDGVLLAGAGAAGPGLVSLARDEHVRAALGGRSGSDRSTRSGTDTLTSYRPVPGLGWAAVAEVPAGEAYAGAQRFTGRVVAVASLLAQVLLAGLVLAVRGERRRHAVEAELGAARDEALAASRLKSDFVANMSHEIRTPMNGVIGLTSLLAESNLDARQREYVNTVQNSADALLNVINDILDFSKIEAGKLAIDPVDFDPRTVAEEVTALVAATAHGKGLEIVTAVHPAIPPMVRGDTHRIRQVLTNLVSNAIKFTSEGQVIVEVEVGEPAQGSQLHPVRFSVTDTGIGIPADRQGVLFEAFTQADTSTTRRYGGTGLGLTISRQLTELMGGTIGFESRPGEGSRFWFELPLPAAGPAPAAGPVAAGDLSGVPVLIVDDHPINRQVLLDLLASSRMRPTAVADAVEALRHLRRAAEQGDPFAVALLDQEMPTMNGVELARAIRADPLATGTHLVMLTSTDRFTEAAAAREAGVEVYLTKPVRAAQLRACLLKLLRDDAPGEAAPAAGDLPPAAPAGARILVAEDNEVNQQVVTEMLARLGYEVDVAPDGEQALAMVQQDRYDAVLMDMQMPRMDGLEATRRIRRLPPPVRDLPVIALTASALASDQERARQAGMTDFLSKPFRMDGLAATLAAALGAGAGRRDHLVPALRTATEVLDPELVAELRTLGPPTFRRLYADWLEGLPEDVRAVLAPGPGPEVAGIAHRLRGAGASLGASRFARACSRLEELALGDPADGELAAAREELRAAADAAGAAVTAMLAAEPAPRPEDLASTPDAADDW